MKESEKNTGKLSGKKQDQQDNSLSNGNELIKYHEVNAFTIVENLETKEILLVMGAELIEKHKWTTKGVEAIKKRLNKTDWDLILKATCIFTNYINSNKNGK